MCPSTDADLNCFGRRFVPGETCFCLFTESHLHVFKAGAGYVAIWCRNSSCLDTDAWIIIDPSSVDIAGILHFHCGRHEFAVLMQSVRCTGHCFCRWSFACAHVCGLFLTAAVSRNACYRQTDARTVVVAVAFDVAVTMAVAVVVAQSGISICQYVNVARDRYLRHLQWISLRPYVHLKYMFREIQNGFSLNVGI